MELVHAENSTTPHTLLHECSSSLSFVHTKKTESGRFFKRIDEIMAHPSRMLFPVRMDRLSISLTTLTCTDLGEFWSLVVLSVVKNYQCLDSPVFLISLKMLSESQALGCALADVWLSSTKDRFIFVLANLGLVPMPFVAIRRSFGCCSLMICIICKAGGWII